MDVIDDLILLKIFSYLPIRDLKSQAITCQKWNILIKETIKTRKQTIQSILFTNDHNLDSIKCQQNDFPNSEYLAAHCISLPMYAELNDVQVNEVINVLNKY